VNRRREHARYSLWFPVQVEAGGEVKLAMNQNIGAGGMLVALCAELKIDEPVSITFRLPTGGEDRTARGRIVRIEPNTEDPDGEWPFKVGIAFDEVAPDLVPFLDDAVARFGA
jgi:PilZ domain